VQLQAALSEFRGAQVVGISADDVATTRELHASLGLDFMLLSDPALAAIDAWGVRHDDESFAVPAVFIVDTDGQVAFRAFSESMIERVTVSALVEQLDALR